MLNSDDKQNKPDNQDKQAKEKQDKQEEMSIDSGMPELENEAKESDQAEEEIEIEDSSQPDLNKKGRNNLGDINYKTYTEEFDEIIKAKDEDKNFIYSPEVRQEVKLNSRNARSSSTMISWAAYEIIANTP